MVMNFVAWVLMSLNLTGSDQIAICGVSPEKEKCCVVITSVVVAGCGPEFDIKFVPTEVIHNGRVYSRMSASIENENK